MPQRCDDDGVAKPDDVNLLLGEWACLGILYPAQTHGFAIAARLKPTGDVGRVWSLSRSLTYRSIDRLTAVGFIHAVGEERGLAGGNRTILAATRSGRHQFRKWLDTPVEHLRDLRSELLLKLILAESCQIDIADMLDRQRDRIQHLAQTIAEQTPANGHPDAVAIWRSEISQAALRFLDRVPAG